MKKLLLIDGHYLLFKMFFGIPPRMRNEGGQLINAVIGFVGALLNYIHLYQPSNIFIAFDSENSKFRKNIYSAYKGNRIEDYSENEDDDNPFIQLLMIRNILDQLHIRHFEVDFYEADDVIASYACQYGQDELEKIIISADKDVLQLIDEQQKISVYVDRGKNSICYDEAYFYTKYGFTPKYFVDYLCFIGDKADNIPGIAGVGPVTATRLIKEWREIEAIVENVACILPLNLQKKIADGKEILFTNKELIKLKKDVVLLYSLEELAIEPETFRQMKTMELVRKYT